MKKINKLATGTLKRNYKLLKLAASSGMKAIKNSDLELPGQIKEVLSSQTHKFVNELGLMKGPVMKMGQMMSMYSETFMSSELKEIFSTLENKSFYLSWEEIQKNIPKDLFDHIDIEETPIAAASLGQVHCGVIKSNHEKIVMKIQYNGVKKAINNDLRVLKILLNSMKLLPRDKDFSKIFAEVSNMLHQETDYTKELDFSIRYKDLLASNNIFYVPKFYSEFSSEKILVSEYIEGISIREFVKEADSVVRNELGRCFFDLFLMEIFSWGIMQTDAHPGNYIIQEKDEQWRMVCIDFGACKDISSDIQEMYFNFIKAVYLKDENLFYETLKSQNFIDSAKEHDLTLLWEYLDIMHEPFEQEEYDWTNSDIPDRLMKMAPKIMNEYALKSPPGDGVFIDRKIAGVFFILKILGAKFSVRESFAQYLR